MKHFFNLILLFAYATIVSGQCTSKTYSFTNPTRIINSNNNGVGTTFRFLNVDSGVNAFVTITKRVNATINTADMDITNTGYSQAWQPTITFPNTMLNLSDSSYIEFKVQFFAVGSGSNINTMNTLPVKQKCMKMTIIDCDGNNNYREIYKISNTNNVQGVNNSALNVSQDSIWSNVVSSNLNNANIDSTWTYGMGMVSFNDTNSFTIRIGCTGKVTSNLNRQFSLYFKSFNNLYVPLAIIDKVIKYNETKSTVFENNLAYPIPFNNELNILIPTDKVTMTEGTINIYSQVGVLVETIKYTTDDNTMYLYSSDGTLIDNKALNTDRLIITFNTELYSNGMYIIKIDDMSKNEIKMTLVIK